jgi:hypothetical protein
VNRESLLFDARRLQDRGRQRGITVTVSQDARYWTISALIKSKPHSADWWPYHAKLVIDAKYKKPIVATNIDEVWAVIVERWLGEFDAAVELGGGN